MDREYGESEVEILAKGLGCDFCGDILVGGGEDANIAVARANIADGHVFALFKNAEEFDLLCGG